MTPTAEGGPTRLLPDDIAQGRIERVRAAVEAGADVNALVDAGEVELLNDSDYPLHIAAQYGQLEVAQYLVQKGASLLQSEHGPHPYHLNAVEELAISPRGTLAMALWLLDSASEPSQDYLGRAFDAGFSTWTSDGREHTRSRRDGFALAQRALARGLRKDGETVRRALLSAASGEDLDGLRFLIEDLGVDPSLDGSAALFDAVADFYTAKESAVAYLLAHGATPTARDAKGHGALFYALRNNQLSVARRLTAAGATLSVEEKSSKDLGSVIYHAAMYDDIGTLRWLLESVGADPNLPDDLGNGLLFNALRNGSKKRAQVLRQYGATLRADEESELAQITSDRRWTLAKNIAISAPGIALWLGYFGLSYVGRGTTGNQAMAQINMWAGPVLAGATLGVAAGWAFACRYTVAGGGFVAVADPIPPGVIVGLATLVTLGVLNGLYHENFASHTALYYAGPVISGVIPLSVPFLLKW